MQNQLSSIEIEGRIEALINQRNEFADQVVMLQGKYAIQQNHITALETQLKEMLDAQLKAQELKLPEIPNS